ncbi:hypothetical protein T11_11186 [Trichinella zimbabwensis]|uniref:Uncharacterized protein n=1 Tax=Trichinella zimbabwensis TaxID=268475 RepID=A0A0V1GAJ0_9BILA|nr:hypothetical protein T11_11186 [Trichinella zimbabwensis]
MPQLCRYHVWPFETCPVTMTSETTTEREGDN